MSNNMTVVCPISLREKAGELGINISETCRKALADEVSKKEKEAGVASRQTVTPTTTTNGGDQFVIR